MANHKKPVAAFCHRICHNRTLCSSFDMIFMHDSFILLLSDDYFQKYSNKQRIEGFIELGSCTFPNQMLGGGV